MNTSHSYHNFISLWCSIHWHSYLKNSLILMNLLSQTVMSVSAAVGDSLEAFQQSPEKWPPGWNKLRADSHIQIASTLYSCLFSHVVVEIYLCSSFIYLFIFLSGDFKKRPLWFSRTFRGFFFCNCRRTTNISTCHVNRVWPVIWKQITTWYPTTKAVSLIPFFRQCEVFSGGFLLSRAGSGVIRAVFWGELERRGKALEWQQRTGGEQLKDRG